MPNWCMNVATFKNKNEAMLQRLADAFNNGATMEEFWPCPQELRDTVAGSVPDETERRALEQKHAENTSKYGAPHWYDWCCNNWGVKWDFGREQDSSAPKAAIQQKDGESFVTISFDTAWSPPLGFYAYLHENFGFEIRAYYFEPGMSFAGSSKNGVESSIQIEEFTQEWLEDNMPAKICEVFNMYEEAAILEEDAKLEEQENNT